MLVAARDEDGTPSVFDGDDFGDVVLKAGTWVSTVNHDRCGLVISEFMCKGIPPGEKRVIDLEKSVIVHFAPTKTPVEELVEACEFLDHCKKTDTTDCMRAIRRALARVKEAANAK